MYERENTIRPERQSKRRDGGHVEASDSRKCADPFLAHVGLVAASDGSVTPDEMIRVGVFGVSPHQMLA
jgi:hypothetical protein